MSSWTCPHDLDGVCQRVAGAVCSPGMRGCVLQGRYVFAEAEKNEPRKPIRATPAEEKAADATGDGAPRRRLPF